MIFDNEPQPAHSRISAFGIVGICCVVFCAILAGRMLFEETILTWNSGPQMLGFSLAHGAGAILFLSPILLVVWLLISGIAFGISRWKRRSFLPSTIYISLAGLLVIGILSIPPQFWIWTFSSSFAHSPHAADIATSAAAQGQDATAKALVRSGLDLASLDDEGRNLTHAAAATGNLRLLQLLHDHHANMNTPDGDGNSPLHYALERKQTAAAQYLQSIGAIRIDGTPEQHEQNLHRQVQRTIYTMHPSQP